MGPPRLLHIDPWESGLKLAGMALASASIVFSAYMIVNSDGAPRITGVEHLAIYSQPATHMASGQRSRRATIDDMPVGSIKRSQPASGLPGYEILQASGDWGLVRMPEGRIMRVRRGSRMAGLGRVIAIERQGGAWRLVTEGGVIGSGR